MCGCVCVVVCWCGVECDVGVVYFVFEWLVMCVLLKGVSYVLSIFLLKWLWCV